MDTGCQANTEYYVIHSHSIINMSADSDRLLKRHCFIKISILILQERMKSSKKLVPRLFGVNKESIVRVDEKTKEVVQV